MTFSDDALQLTEALKLMPDPLNVSCLIISSFWCFSAAAYKAGKIATNPFQGGNAPGAGAMVPPPASMGGREYWLQVLLLVSLLFGVGHAPTSNSDFVLITSVLVLEFFSFCFLVKLSKGRKTCLAAVLALCSCDYIPCPFCLQSLLFLWNLSSRSLLAPIGCEFIFLAYSDKLFWQVSILVPFMVISS